MNEEFEKWAKDQGYKVDWVNGGYKYSLTHQAWGFWQARQPEIDALKDEAARLREIIRGRTPAAYQILELERDALKAEVEKLRDDAGLANAESDKYFLQDKRDYVGNDMLFWATGGGYTTDLRKAEIFTREEAMKQHSSRNTDVPWPVGYIYSKSRPAVDMQHVKRKDVIGAMTETK